MKSYFTFNICRLFIIVIIILSVYPYEKWITRKIRMGLIVNFVIIYSKMTSFITSLLFTACYLVLAPNAVVSQLQSKFENVTLHLNILCLFLYTPVFLYPIFFRLTRSQNRKKKKSNNPFEKTAHSPFPLNRVI